MSKKWSNLLLLAFLIAFVGMGLSAMYQARAEDKPERIYKEIRVHSPYLIEKRMLGLSIRSKITNKVEKPPASKVYLRFDELEKMWGKENFVIDKDILIINDANKSKVAEIKIMTPKERAWLKSYFDIQ